MPPKPLISIITVCYNAQKTIEATIQSVLCQSYAPIEYIIVDGHSTDQTLAIIQKYQDKIALTISEKDLGIYDAMNKGIKRASGEIIYFLNADDSFCDTKVVEDIVAEFKSGDWDLILGLVQPVHDQVDFTAPLKNPWRTMFTRKRDIILTQI